MFSSRTNFVELLDAMKPESHSHIGIIFEERRITLLLSSLLMSRGLNVLSARLPEECNACHHVITEPIFLSAFFNKNCLVICPPGEIPAVVARHPACVILRQPFSEASVERALFEFIDPSLLTTDPVLMD